MTRLLAALIVMAGLFLNSTQCLVACATDHAPPCHRHHAPKRECAPQTTAAQVRHEIAPPATLAEGNLASAFLSPAIVQHSDQSTVEEPSPPDRFHSVLRI